MDTQPWYRAPLKLLEESTMVKTKAPLLSLSAGGQIGKVLTASNWKGRTYIKKLTVPANPNTAAQVGVRQMMQWLTQHWDSLTPGSKTSWSIPAAIDNITPFDAFIQLNLQRWATGLYPGHLYPIAESRAPSTAAFNSAVPQGRGILLTYTVTNFYYAGGTIFYRTNSTGFTPHYTNAIRTLDPAPVGPATYFDTPLTPGTYYYRQYFFSDDGQLRTSSQERAGTVT